MECVKALILCLFADVAYSSAESNFTLESQLSGKIDPVDNPIDLELSLVCLFNNATERLGTGVIEERGLILAYLPILGNVANPSMKFPRSRKLFLTSRLDTKGNILARLNFDCTNREMTKANSKMAQRYEGNLCTGLLGTTVGIDKNGGFKWKFVLISGINLDTINTRTFVFEESPHKGSTPDYKGVIGDPLFINFKIIGFLVTPEDENGNTAFVNINNLQGPWKTRYNAKKRPTVVEMMTKVEKYSLDKKYWS